MNLDLIQRNLMIFVELSCLKMFFFKISFLILIQKFKKSKPNT